MSSKRILIVDDDPVIRSLVNDILASLGHQVFTVENGTLCLANVSDLNPEIIMLDLQMPDMSGFQVLAGLREMQNSAKVIMLSANSDTEQMAIEQNLTADYYLEKPFTVPDIIKILAKIS